MSSPKRNRNPTLADLAKVSPKVAKSVDARILTLDIETRPHMAYVWGLWKQNVGLSQLMQHGHVMCLVAKWYRSGEVEFLSDHHDGHESMIRRAWHLLDQADIVVTYNGLAFDIPHLNREFAILGLRPPSPWKDVDLIRTVRKEFNFASNSLANVVKELGVGEKMDNGGFDLWTRCIEGDPEAWETMRQYNVTDVAITEKLYDRLRPWIKNHPHMGMWVESDDSGESWACPNCGTQKIRYNPGDTVKANVQRYRSYTCPKCGTPIRGNTRLLNPTQTRRAL